MLGSYTSSVSTCPFPFANPRRRGPKPPGTYIKPSRGTAGISDRAVNIGAREIHTSFAARSGVGETAAIVGVGEVGAKVFAGGMIVGVVVGNEAPTTGLQAARIKIATMNKILVFIHGSWIMRLYKSACVA